MRKLLCTLAAVSGLVVLTFLTGGVGHGQDKPGKKKPAQTQEEPTAQDYAQFNQAKEAVGTITYVDVGAHTMTVRIEFTKMVPNTTAPTKNATAQQTAMLKAQQQVMRDYQSILTSRNPQQQQQRMQKLMIDYQNLQNKLAQSGYTNNQYKTVTTTKEMDVVLSDELRVARTKLETNYDDKGNLVIPSEEEKKKMQDATMPGYKAKVDDLQVGQGVKLYLGTPPKKKKASPTETDPKDNKVDPKDNKEEKKAGDEGEEKTTKKPAVETFGKTGTTASEQPRPFVRLVLIQTEPEPAAKTPEKKKKKN